MRLARACCLVIPFLFHAGLATADQIILKGGNSMRGSVVSEDDRYLVLKTLHGSVTLAKSDVLEVKYSSAKENKILADLAGLSSSDVTGRLRLAKRANAGGLRVTARRIYAQVLAISPNEKTARKALGYVRYAGEWVVAQSKGGREGMVSYEGRWVTPLERDSLAAGEAEKKQFEDFGLESAEGYRLLGEISDFDIQIEPRGGFIVRRHVKTYKVEGKPYVFSVDALTWKRLGIFVGVSFIDAAREKIPGFGKLTVTIYKARQDALGNRKPGDAISQETFVVSPGMWEKKSDFTYWDTRINHSAYEKHASEELKREWAENTHMNFDGILFVLVNRDVELLRQPGAYYIEAVFTLRNREKKTGRWVQYAEAR